MNYKEVILKAKGREEELSRQIKAKKDSLTFFKERKISIEEAQILIQQAAKDTQENLVFYIEDIVQSGIDICFPDQYKFCIDFIIKRNKTECDLYIVDEHENRINPLDSNGGGLVDIISFCLRIACWSISNTDNIIILDEPFKWLDKTKRPLAGDLIKQLSEKLNLQILMVTHDQEMIDVADKLVEL